MKHYPEKDWLFGDQAGPSIVTGIWVAKSENLEEYFEINFFWDNLEEFIDNDELMSIVIFFRKMKANSLNRLTKLFQKNQIEIGTENPHTFMNEEDGEMFFSLSQSHILAKEWLPIVEAEARNRNLDGELNQNVF